MYEFTLKRLTLLIGSAYDILQKGVLRGDQAPATPGHCGGNFDGFTLSPGTYY